MNNSLHNLHLSFEKRMANPEIFFTQWCFVPGLIASGGENISSLYCFFIITQSFPFRKRHGLSFELLSPRHLKMFCSKFGWNWQSGSWEDDIFKLSMYLYISLLSLLGKGCSPSYNLHLRMLCSMFGWNWLTRMKMFILISEANLRLQMI